MIETIQEMEHHTRTAFGDSKDHFGNVPGDLPSQGVLQGNGAGPASWSAIEAILAETMKAEGFGFESWSLIRQRALAITCFAFVDDTDLIHANNDPSVDTKALIQEAQTGLKLWEDLIRVTGGDLAPHKSYWYLVEVIWKNGRWTYASEDDIPGDLWLGDGTRERPLTLVDRLEPHQDEEALEVDLEQEISPETKDLRELESLESTDASLVSTENVSESSTDGAENSTDPQNEQSAANLQFLQERYNRIANAALEEGKLELAKDCYDSLAKILRLMK